MGEEMILWILLLLLPISARADEPEYHLEVRSSSRIDTILVETCVEDFGDSLKITKTYEPIETTDRWYVEVYPDGHEEPSYADYCYTVYGDSKYKPWERFLQNYKTIQWKRVK